MLCLTMVLNVIFIFKSLVSELGIEACDIVQPCSLD
jgi:hypothetical protein